MTRFFPEFAYRGPYESESEEVILSRLDYHKGLIAVDTETVNTLDLTCLGIGIYISPSEGFYFRVFPETHESIPQVMGMLGDKEIRKLYHNGQGFDLPVLDKLSSDEGLTTPDSSAFEDSEILAKCSGLPGGLQRVGQEWLGYTDLFSIQDLMAEFNTKSMLDIPWERVAEKCLNDCRTTYAIWEYLQARVSAAQRDCYSVDARLVHVLRQIEVKGLALRQGVLEEYRDRLEGTVNRIIRECDAEGFHPGSNVQKGYVLASRGNILPFTKGTRKQLSVTEEVLEGLDDPLAKTLIEYNKAIKLLSSYIRPWLGQDRAYTHFRLDLATGRLASGRINSWDTKNRNLQNIPPAVREVFKPDPQPDGSSLWTWADHGQIELRMLAYISKDRAMLAEYAKSDPDLHSATMYAAQSYGLPNFTRANGKTFNFARVFGAGNKQLHKATGVPMNKVNLVRSAMADLFPESEAWIKQTMENPGEYAETIFGRRMRLPELREDDDHTNPRAFAAHVSKCAVNYPCQGSAADIVKRGMLKIWETGVDLRLQVHDEYLVNGYWEPEESLAHIHPEIYTPFETKRSLIWS